MEASNTVPNRKNSSLELYDAWDYYNNAIKENYFSSLAPTSLIDWVDSTSTSLGAVSILSDISVLILSKIDPLKIQTSYF